MVRLRRFERPLKGFLVLPLCQLGYSRIIWHLRYGSNVDMTRFWRPPPYQLGYEGIRSLRSDSNRQPPEPKSGALPSCATERFKTMAHTRDYDTPTSCVTSKRSSSELRVRIWCSMKDLNFQPYACRASALPLRQPSTWWYEVESNNRPRLFQGRTLPN